jgi:SOS-response transcriptional repressor LexA
MEEGMTPKRLRLIQLVHSYWHHHQMGPTLEELARLMGLKSRSNVHMTIEALIQQGWLAKTPKEQRGVALTEKGLNLCKKTIFTYLPPPPSGGMLPSVRADGTKMNEKT